MWGDEEFAAVSRFVRPDATSSATLRSESVRRAQPVWPVATSASGAGGEKRTIAPSCSGPS
jgi:hypothetical protein